MHLLFFLISHSKLTLCSGKSNYSIASTSTFDFQGQGRLFTCFISKMADPQTEPSASGRTRGSTGSVDTKNRDAIASGVFELLKPAVDEIDDRVKTVR
jgi:hypothetical protein